MTMMDEAVATYELMKTRNAKERRRFVDSMMAPREWTFEARDTSGFALLSSDEQNLLVGQTLYNQQNKALYRIVSWEQRRAGWIIIRTERVDPQYPGQLISEERWLSICGVA